MRKITIFFRDRNTKPQKYNLEFSDGAGVSGIAYIIRMVKNGNAIAITYPMNVIDHVIDIDTNAIRTVRKI